MPGFSPNQVFLVQLDDSGAAHVVGASFPLKVLTPTIAELAALGLAITDYPDAPVTILADPSVITPQFGIGISLATAYAFGPLPADATKLMVQVFAQNVRYTLDGTTPVGTPGSEVGFQLRAGDPPQVIAYGANTVVTIIEELPSAHMQACWLR